MAGHARKEIVRKGEIGTYHTWSRCVQRACLCGEDPVTGYNFEHRRVWIRTLLEYQASVFAVDVGNYSVLSNHQHLIARTRPDISATWSDEEVAWRWKLAWPAWIDKQWVCEPTDREIEELLAVPEKIVQLRENLADLSWFMARWKEPIAKMANRESETKGHFYEQRFGSRELLDEGALLCCSVYVDLNQVKAGLARSLDESKHSAICDRLQSWRKREVEASLDEFHAGSLPGYELKPADMERLLADCFLSPIDDQGPLLLLDASNKSGIHAKTLDEIRSPPGQAEGVPEDGDELPESGDSSSSAVAGRTLPGKSPSEEAEKKGAKSGKSAAGCKPTRKIHRRLQRHRRRRASDQPILAMSPQQYEQIARITADRSGIPSPIPPPEYLPDLLRDRGVEPSRWFDVIEHFGNWFHWAAGCAGRVAEASQRAGRQWVHGIRACRDVFT